jgi:branched-chain amino acid transport system ATP-binding protein
MNHPLLTVTGLSKHFGGLRAVDNVDFELFPEEILGILGPNGAGKTVCFNLICGVYKPTKGEISLDGQRIDGLSTYEIANLGIGRTFQIVKPFSSLTVLENVLVARGITRYNSLSKIWSVWQSSAEKNAALQILKHVGLADMANRKAGLLPLGYLRRLEIARALVVGSRIILLDESFSGLRSEEIAQLENLIQSIRQDGITVLLIEHNVRVSMGICDRIVVLDHGRKIAEGEPEAIQRNDSVIEAYLGRRRGRDAA